MENQKAEIEGKYDNCGESESAADALTQPNDDAQSLTADDGTKSSEMVEMTDADEKEKEKEKESESDKGSQASEEHDAPDIDTKTEAKTEAPTQAESGESLESGETMGAEINGAAPAGSQPSDGQYGAKPEEKTDKKETEKEAEKDGIIRYRWNYESQRATDEQQNSARRRSGIFTYAMVMTAFFAVSFTILIASLLAGSLTGRGQSQNGTGDSQLGSNRVVYVREENGESGTLTIQEIAEQSKPCVVAVVVNKTTGAKGSGSGFTLTEDGYIATNYHVVEDASSIQVQLYDGTIYAAKLINFSEPDDLAVLKIDAADLPVMPIGDSDDVLVGDRVVIIGHPAGLEYGWSTTDGILSAINREVKIKNSDGTLNKKMTLLQTNANVNNGNSGGPMINEYGEVIGIISMKLANGYEGMGFAIPINGAMEIINAIVEQGHADNVESTVSQGRPVLGVTGFDVIAGMTVIRDENGQYSRGFGSTEDVTGTIYSIDRPGFFIVEVSQTGDAYGKLQEADLIVAIDGTETSNRSEMMAIMDDKNIGDSVVIDFIRQGELHSVKIRLIAENNAS